MGIDRDSISAQCSERRPGNSHTAVSQARLTPKSRVQKPTPNTKMIVLPSRRASWVSIKCCQSSVCGSAQLTTLTLTVCRTKTTIMIMGRRQIHGPQGERDAFKFDE